MSDLLLRRRLMMVGGSPTPPVPYQKVEYLIGNGNGACLDTGIVPNSDYTIKCKFMLLGTLGRNTHIVLGSGASFSSQNIELYNGYVYVDRFNLGYNSYTEQGTANVNEWYTIVFNKNDVTVYNADNSVNVHYVFAASSFNCPYTMYLFALHRASVVRTGGLVGIQTFQLIDGNNTIVADYTAIRDNGVGYMYDSVTQSLIGSATATPFPYGPDIN